VDTGFLRCDALGFFESVEGFADLSSHVVGLGDAYRMELVTRNVATQVNAPPIDRQRRVGLDVAEAERLFEVISGEGWRLSTSWR
jgi:hypothetical protein